MGTQGDCYDRFLLRLRELIEDLYLLLQLVQIKYFNYFTLQANDMFTLVNYFLHFQNLVSTGGVETVFVEAGKGLFGVSLSFSSGASLRCRFRSPAFFNLQILKFIAAGIYFSDLTALLGTLDIVFGEIDR